MPSEVADILAEQSARRAKADADHWKAQVKALERQLDIAERRLEFVDAIRDRQQQRLIERTKASGGGVAMLVLSDWHCGEKVDPHQVQRLNSYSPAIFQKRATALWQHAATMLDWARKLATIDTLIVWALGDFITGYIHEELRKSNYLSPNEETLLFQDELFSGLKFLRKEAGMKSVVVITKCGNHGRTTEKNQAKDEHKNSFEWLAYKSMEKYFQIPGVQHQYTPMTTCVVNSSLIGYSEYSIVNGFSWEPPSQTLIVDSEKRGGIITERVFCE